jgi:hypothetical protein
MEKNVSDDGPVYPCKQIQNVEKIRRNILTRPWSGVLRIRFHLIGIQIKDSSEIILVLDVSKYQKSIFDE